MVGYRGECRVIFSVLITHSHWLIQEDVLKSHYIMRSNTNAGLVRLQVSVHDKSPRDTLKKVRGPYLRQALGKAVVWSWQDTAKGRQRDWGIKAAWWGGAWRDKFPTLSRKEGSQAAIHRWFTSRLHRSKPCIHWGYWVNASTLLAHYCQLIRFVELSFSLLQRGHCHPKMLLYSSAVHRSYSVTKC